MPARKEVVCDVQLETALRGGDLLETGEWNEVIHHHRSDERLDEMISSVSQVLEWMNKTRASTKNFRVGGIGLHIG